MSIKVKKSKIWIFLLAIILTLGVFGIAHDADARRSYLDQFNTYFPGTGAGCGLCHVDPGGGGTLTTTGTTFANSGHNYASIKPTDTTPPTVTITSPTTNPTYPGSSSPLTIGGTASDNFTGPFGVTQISWSNSLGGSGTATGTNTWSASGIALSSGTNVITVTALDAAGNKGTNTLTVTYTPSPVVTAPVINSFTATANPNPITSGQTSTVTLSWNLSGGTPDALSIDNGVGSVLGLATKTVTVSPTTTTTYTYNLTASNGGGPATKQATVTVTVTVTQPPPVVTAPVINSFTATANPNPITSGQTSTVTLSWNLSGGTPDALSIDNGVGSVLGSTTKTVTVSPTTTTTYTYNLTASNGGGPATKQATVTVTVTVTQPPPAVTAPVINSFTAGSSPITSGQSSRLSWTLSGGTPTTLSINNGVGSVLGSTFKDVTPSQTTTYTLTASNSAGNVTKSVTVTVTQSLQPQPPTVDLTNWSGQWLKVTIKYDGYFYGQSSSGESSADENSPKMANDHENIGAYLKFGSLDPNQPDVLQGELYQYDTKSSQWVKDSLTLHIIGGTPTDFLCWSQVNGDFTTGFTARIQGRKTGGILKSATFKTLGGYYFETTSGTLVAGKISISGSLVPESKVPVPK